MIRQAVAVATAALVVSGCSSSGGPSTQERTAPRTTTAPTTTTSSAATTPPVSGERQLCVDLAAVDLSNPQELLNIRVPGTTDPAFDVPSSFLLAKLTALEAALNAGTNPAYPTQEAANAVTNVLDACRQGGYL
jgi:hypothetical protein